MEITMSLEAKASPALIEALMTHVLMATSTAYWNVNQAEWGWSNEEDGTDEPASDVKRYPPMQLGDVLVTHREFQESGGLLFEYHFGDLTVDTWFDSKRMFYHSNLSRDMTRYELVDWFQRLIDHLHGLAVRAIEDYRGRGRKIEEAKRVQSPGDPGVTLFCFPNGDDIRAI